MAWVAAESLSSVDRLLARPQPVAMAQFKALGRVDARLLLRYQVIMGGLFFFFVLFATSENKFALSVVLVMIAAVLVQRFLLTPGMTSLGRMIDFVPPDAPSGERTQFWVLHGWYWEMEVVKWALGLALAGRLIARRSRRSGYARQQINMVDKANHRHVDGL